MTPLREHYLLTFIELPGGDYGLDRIRLMKGMFLFTKEGPSGVRTLYNFKPFDWGPFSPDVYQDLESLDAEGWIGASGGEPYEVYSATKIGQQRAEELRESMPNAVLETLGNVKMLTTSLSFLDLLEYVYERYPRYARKSKLKR